MLGWPCVDEHAWQGTRQREPGRRQRGAQRRNGRYRRWRSTRLAVLREGSETVLFLFGIAVMAKSARRHDCGWSPAFLPRFRRHTALSQPVRIPLKQVFQVTALADADRRRVSPQRQPFLFRPAAPALGLRHLEHLSHTPAERSARRAAALAGRLRGADRKASNHRLCGHLAAIALASFMCAGSPRRALPLKSLSDFSVVHCSSRPLPKPFISATWPLEFEVNTAVSSASPICRAAAGRPRAGRWPRRIQPIDGPRACLAHAVGKKG